MDLNELRKTARALLLPVLAAVIAVASIIYLYDLYS